MVILRRRDRKLATIPVDNGLAVVDGEKSEDESS
jgi:hypothetical protein